MNDLISRQAAIANAISGRTREIDGEKWIRVSEVRESIKTLPSAQPERCEDCVNFSKTRLLIPQPEIIRCKDCKWSYDAIGGTFCSHGVCVDCVVYDDWFCAGGERKDGEA